MELLSIGVILILGFLAGIIFDKIKLPKIIGMIVVGIFIGPSFLNIIDDSILNISTHLRMIALIIILTRSGLSLDIKKFKQIGRPAILMCFVPAIFEIIGVVIFATLLLNINIFESILLGSVLAAVSPAIVIPRMIDLKNKGYGVSKNIPELIMAGASADDIFVIALFYAVLNLLKGGNLSLMNIINIPISIILGILLGIIIGFILSTLFTKFKFDIIFITLIVLSTSFIMIGVEILLVDYLSISALLAIISLAMTLFIKHEKLAVKLEINYQGMWKFFEILLFVLVGISVDINYALSQGFTPILIILIGLTFRMIGVYVSLLFTDFNFKEKMFIMVSYIPKATVQASIGGLALASGLQIGALVLTTAVLSILITAPLGALIIDNTHHITLNKLSYDVDSL
ncbi:cation:proton antiporter [Acholeplasma granularum]|uniref:cation:proton antiporter domain-containing protein n=1 Tax=Acholeplasma granularum TaxID=264635 RepID=UPI00046EE822|nr:cation:proton antiporter [Acholeplasma granularum]